MKLVNILTITSCAANNTDTADNLEQKIDNSQETTESEKKPEEPNGIVVDGELRFYDGELVNTAKQLIKNSLILNDVEIGIGFSIDIEDNITDENSITYCKIYSNKYNFKSTKEIEQLLINTYSNKETIYKTSHSGDILESELIELDETSKKTLGIRSEL